MIYKLFCSFTNMCAPAWEALTRTALLAFVCVLCALMLSIHGQNQGGLTLPLLHIVQGLCEVPAGLFVIAAVGVCLLQSRHGGC